MKNSIVFFHDLPAENPISHCNHLVLPEILVVFFWNVGCRYLAKIIAPEGSKDVAVGQPIAITVS